MDYKRYMKCERKIKFKTKAKAEKVRKSMSKISKEKYIGARLEAYKCNYCGMWHLGHAIYKSKEFLRTKEKLKNKPLKKKEKNNFDVFLDRKFKEKNNEKAVTGSVYPNLWDIKWMKNFAGKWEYVENEKGKRTI